jgi:winged helix DNA-binding protein
MRRLSTDQVRWLRLRAQGLDGGRGPGSAAVSVGDAVCTAAALQAQAAGPARVQVWSRSTGLKAADVDAACASADVVRTWLMRGTLHMVVAEDLRALLTVLGPVNLRNGRRRREQLGLTDAVCARAMEVLPNILAGRRALTRAEIVSELAGHGVALDIKTQAPPHLLAYAANSGLICRGPDVARDEPAYVLIDEWLATATHTDRESALALLAERHFAAYGPASAADLAAWSGLPAAEARAAVALIRDTLEEVDHDGTRLLLPRDGRSEDPRPPQRPYRLLARFDPYLLGHRSRDLILDPSFAKRVNAGGGMIAQTMLADGRIAGTWTAAALEPFGEVSAAARKAWHEEREALAAFLV